MFATTTQRGLIETLTEYAADEFVGNEGYDTRPYYFVNNCPPVKFETAGYKTVFADGRATVEHPADFIALANTLESLPVGTVIGQPQYYGCEYEHTTLHVKTAKDKYTTIPVMDSNGVRLFDKQFDKGVDQIALHARVQNNNVWYEHGSHSLVSFAVTPETLLPTLYFMQQTGEILQFHFAEYNPETADWVKTPEFAV